VTLKSDNPSSPCDRIIGNKQPLAKITHILGERCHTFLQISTIFFLNDMELHWFNRKAVELRSLFGRDVVLH